jgi:nitronate monooxygenase
VCSTSPAAPGGRSSTRADREGIARGDLPAQPVWASQAIGLIHDLPPAGDLVGVLAAQAEEALARASAG